jgi:tetratricopeptide (TPR) repeat protein
VLFRSRGFSATETTEVYKRARVLAERNGGPGSLQVFTGLWASANTRGELRRALAFTDQMLEIAQADGNPSALATAHYAGGLSRHWLGDLAGARRHLLEAVKHYRENDFAGAQVDCGVRALSWLGPVEWQLGHPEGAIQYLDDALKVARRQKHPYNLTFATYIGGSVHVLRRDLGRAIEANDETLKLGTEFGFPLWSTLGKIRDAWLRAQIGQADGATDRIREGLAELDSGQFFGARVNSLGLLCETQAAVGAIDDALLTAEQALQANPEELIFRPNALRLRGELRLRSSAGDGAFFELSERDFREGIELARTMSAKSQELRVTASLARLLANLGRLEEARAILAEIYNWFTEGFDTPDLQDAKTLLDELNE